MKRDYREDFPLLESGGVIYLDSAATSQRPQAVLEAEQKFYRERNANPKRGLYDLSVLATESYENSRRAVREFIGAKEDCEIIFTRNTTESINLAAHSYGLSNLGEGDEILLTIMEHHSNIVPWQTAARLTGAKIQYLYCDEEGVIPQKEIENKLTSRTKVVGIAHVSNVLGCENPVRRIADLAHRMGAVVVVDAAQSIPHIPVDVEKLGADFLAFSGHKMMGPFGIGVLYGRKELLEEMPPFLTGGEMIETVTEQSAVFARLPEKFEAGTVNVSGAVGLAAAIEYLKSVGYRKLRARDEALVSLMISGMEKIPGVHILGSPDPSKHCGIVSFTVDGVHPHDAASIFSEHHIAVRAGHHCAQPLSKHLGVLSTVRASVGLYNTEEDVMKFLDCLRQLRGWLGYGY